MIEEQTKVVHDFLFRQAGKKAYSLARLKALTELAKLHREEFLQLVHKNKEVLLPNSVLEAERRFQSLTPSDIPHFAEKIQWMANRTRERSKARRQLKKESK